MLLPGAGCTAGSAQGLRKLSLEDERAGSGRIDAKATFGKASIPAIVGPLEVTVVLGPDAASGAAGACGSATFAASDCTFDSSGTMFMCQ